jgi:DNA-binding beta-propeller fold protein YncE
MVHAAMSQDGRLLAAGYQSSLHYVFDGETYEIIGEVGHWSEYPHHTVFSDDESLIAFNSCHFYNGVTIGVPTSLLPGLKTEPYDREDERIVPLQSGARVYAAVARRDEFIVGDALGYLRAFDNKGRFRWQHFIGSTVGDIDIGPDGRRLVVSTYAGFLCFIGLDTGEADPYQIGTATHRERRRWLFWRQENGPLRW